MGSSSPINSYAFPLKARDYAATPVPSLEDWQTMWKAWDLVTTQMIPAEALMEQPIELRNPLKFYVGHIPTFEDIHLARATGQELTEPAYYADCFQRGIDPDVDDPTQCHDHSELPSVWPALQEMLEYREKVKERIRSLYKSGVAYEDRCIGRALWIGYEHEGLHLETFLYMSILSPNILPPPGLPRPEFAQMAKQAAAQRVENQWFHIPEQQFTIGYEDPENDDGPNRFFAWDNEREPYDVKVHSFEAKGRPVSIGEYCEFLFEKDIKTIPATWIHVDSGIQQVADEANGKGQQHATTVNCDAPLNGEVPYVVSNGQLKRDALQSFIAQLAIRTVWGPIPLSHALDWPLTSSYNEISAYASWAGARLPTMREVRSIHELVERQKGALGHSALNHTCHVDPEAIFVDFSDDANVGLQNFHQVPVTQNGGRLCGLGDFGGAWEWSCDLFAPQPGFKPMDIYPGYSEDFMDGKHIAITGGSWALPPRIAGRKSFQNWWQKAYAYPWVAGRLVRDI